LQVGTIASSDVIALPKGGGALSSVGEKFSPDLHTGTGNFTVPIALPPGRNGFQPSLNLVYSTGNGNGPFGLGWSLSIPGVSRKTSDGVPRYNETKSNLDKGERRDVFILSGAEDLVPISGSYPGEAVYRPRTEGLFARITHHLPPTPDADNPDTNYWQVESKDGLVSIYGSQSLSASDPAVLSQPDNAKHIFAWKLTETKDTFGNLIRYEYEPDSGDKDGHRWNQPLLQRIRYADYGDPANDQFLVHVEFSYDGRPDPFSDYRAGFEIRTSKRCRAIKVSIHTADGEPLNVREYRFTYHNDPNNGISLLQRIDIIGYDDEQIAYEDDDPKNKYRQQLPPLTFDYTVFEPEKRRFEVVEGRDLPTRALGAADMELVDLHGCGLPDILEMNGAVCRFWRNLGGGSFDMPRPMREAPAHSLADTGVQLIDANGDGRMDLLVTHGPLAGYYPLNHGAAWDRRSFRRHDRTPSFSLDDPEVRLVDLTGDGVTDVLRSGTSFECYFNHPLEGWLSGNTARIPRQTLDAFPNVNFSDPRVRFADMSGDGLQDIVLIHDGNVEYWPNLGHGHWGRRLSMRHAPRYRDSGYQLDYDPRRILVGDVDGDGLADIVYVGHDQVLLWLNHSGNAWSAEPIVIQGTPPVTDLDNLRLVDLNGTGVSGVLWSSDAHGLSRHRLMFLDFTGGVKPYLLNEMDNHMGAVTRVEYKSSTHYFLEDQKNPATRWRTPLPFPVQVVSRVEVIDQISKGKLTTEYRYHHGYWDGAEREFRGFGRVEQFDTETIDTYHGSELHGAEDFERFLNTALERHFSPPTLTKTWFHQGPVGEEFGDWQEVDYTHEYWQGDPQLLDHTEKVNAFLGAYNDRPGGNAASPRNRRIKRDALHTLRGSVLRSELYALDGSRRQDRPYTVTEHAYDLEEIAPPSDSDSGERPRIFFPHPVAQRSTQWERGDDPLTQFSFTDYQNENGRLDAFGRPHRQTAVAMPRLAGKRRPITGAVVGDIQPDETHILATHTDTRYAIPSDDRHYLHDRVAQTKVYEFRNPPGAPDALDDTVQMALRKQRDAARKVWDDFTAQQPGILRVIGDTINHYDGRAFEGLPVGDLGRHGALVHTETLILTEQILQDAYGDANAGRHPSYLDGSTADPNLPADFGGDTGYRKVPASADGHLEGWYADTERRQYDFQTGAARPRGLVLVMRDARGHDTSIGYDRHDLLPERVTDAKGLETQASYNYRVMQPARLTDPNDNSTYILYSPIGLPEAQFVQGTDVQGNETLGGTAEKPDIRFEYDFCHFRNSKAAAGKGLPIFVHTHRRIHHASAGISDETIQTREYSDGFGRLVQTRSQAEEFVFGDTGDDVGLPIQADVAPGPAVAQKTKDAVVVSGWQVYDNKGRVIEKYEPFFSQEFEFEPDTKKGQHATLFYDPRGNPIRTLNPDGSQQRVILGRPRNPSDLTLTADDLLSADVPDGFEPTPWETYTYDANDLAELTHPGANRADASHPFTPANSVSDALGRVLCQVQRNGGNPARDWFITRTEYDLRGNTVKIIDALGRNAFLHAFDLLNRPLRVESIDAGLRTSVLDASGNLIEYRDSKGSLVRHTYDELNRPKELWARDDIDGQLTLRERIVYGDEGDHALARAHNTLGKPIRHYDEAGLLETPEYDFKGNQLEKSRRTIRDEALANGWRADWNASDADKALEAAAYQTSSRYDALNRPIEIVYPEDVKGQRKTLTPYYNRAGALDAVKLGGKDYVRHISYNAKGQRVLIVYGSGVISRHAYDPQTFRLARLRTERLREPGFFARLADFFSGGETDRLGFETSGVPLQDFVYGYDLAGNITAIDERTPGCGIRNTTHGADRLLREFTYDPIYRLLSASGRACRNETEPRRRLDSNNCGFFPGGQATPNQDNAPDLTESYTERFQYDPAGNMLSLAYEKNGGGVVWRRVFGMGGLPNDQWTQAPDNRLTSLTVGQTEFRYEFDANGNLIRQNGAEHHAWDHADRMIGYQVKANDTSPPSIQARYLYGADGMRVKKWVRNQGDEVTTTIYIDGIFEQHRLTKAGTDKTNNTLHVMENQSRIALVRVGESLDERDASPKVQYHLGDHLGSSHVVVGGDKANADKFINREEYFPYGETSFGSFTRKRYRYSGKERDEESGLYYYGARYLAPWMGRWVSCDPAGIVAGLNPFLENSQNPLRFKDPSGMAPIDVIRGTTENFEQQSEQNAEHFYNEGSYGRMTFWLVNGALWTVAKNLVPTEEDIVVGASMGPAAPLGVAGSRMETIATSKGFALLQRMRGWVGKTDPAELIKVREELVQIIHKRELGRDLARGEKTIGSHPFSPRQARQAEVGALIERSTGRRLTPTQGPDWVDDLGKTWDLVETGPSEHFNLDNVVQQIVAHTQKADRVPVLIDDLSKDQATNLFNTLKNLVGKKVKLPKKDDVEIEVTQAMLEKVHLVTLGE
jgi:RHS repeat-associated protein